MLQWSSETLCLSAMLSSLRASILSINNFRAPSWFFHKCDNLLEPQLQRRESRGCRRSLNKMEKGRFVLREVFRLVFIARKYLGGWLVNCWHSRCCYTFMDDGTALRIEAMRHSWGSNARSSNDLWPVLRHSGAAPLLCSFFLPDSFLFSGESRGKGDTESEDISETWISLSRTLASSNLKFLRKIGWKNGRIFLSCV